MGLGTVQRSTTSTVRRRRPASRAVLSPNAPPPTTMRSKRSPVMRLGIEPADLMRVCDAADTLHEGGRAQVHAFFSGCVPHPREGPRHDLLEPGDDLGLLPEVELQSLHPLEIGDHHAAAIGEDVGDDHDAAGLEDGVRLRRGGTVGALYDDARVDARGVVLADLRADGRGHEDIARLLQDVRVGDGVRTREAHHSARLMHVLLEAPDVEPLAVPDPALEVAHPLDNGAVAPEDAGGGAAHVAEALHHHRLALQLLAQAVQRLVQDVDDATPRGLAPARGASHEDGLARDHSGYA